MKKETAEKLRSIHEKLNDDYGWSDDQIGFVRWELMNLLEVLIEVIEAPGEGAE